MPPYEKVKCPRCGQESPFEFNYCPKCATPLKSDVFPVDFRVVGAKIIWPKIVALCVVVAAVTAVIFYFIGRMS